MPIIAVQLFRLWLCGVLADLTFPLNPSLATSCSKQLDCYRTQDRVFIFRYEYIGLTRCFSIVLCLHLSTTYEAAERFRINDSIMAILTPTPAPAASEDEICPCCKWRKAYGRSDQIFKPLEELEAASRNGCLRCKIVVEAVRAVCRSSVGDGKEMIQFSNISEVELLNRNSMEKIEIFALPGTCGQLCQSEGK